MNNDVNYRWWAIFVGQIVTGLVLTFYSDVEFGKFLLASALGQGVTGGMGPTK